MLTFWRSLLLTSFLFLSVAVRAWNELRSPFSIPAETVNEWLEADFESMKVGESFRKGLEAAAGCVRCWNPGAGGGG